jgi:hypothetical protein
MKTVTMHQPNYLPWIGFFSKVACSDCLVIADTFQYIVNGVINRNKIRTKEGWHYLTIPVGRRYDRSRICDVPLPADNSWRIVHWNTIRHSYISTDFFAAYQDFFENLYLHHDKLENLAQINEEIILYLLRCFNIKVEIIKVSELDANPDLRKTDRIIELLKLVDADLYLSGPSGRNYLEFEKFSQHNLGLKFFQLEHPVYQQRYPSFESNLAAIDLLFNMGPQAEGIIRASGRIEDYVG